jgi:hypothetical protein
MDWPRTSQKPSAKNGQRTRAFFIVLLSMGKRATNIAPVSHFASFEKVKEDTLSLMNCRFLGTDSIKTK